MTQDNMFNKLLPHLTPSKASNGERPRFWIESGRGTQAYGIRGCIPPFTFSEEVILIPNILEKWRLVAEDFQRRWNILYACRILNGRHDNFTQEAQPFRFYILQLL